MAYDFIGLTNDVCRRLNETELTSTQFGTTTGVYSQIKDAVNAAIRDINQSHFQFPFNHNFDTITLTAGQLRYPLPANAKYVDFDTVRLQRSTTPLVENARRLTQLSYDEYVSRFIDEEFKANGKEMADEVQHWHVHDCTFQFVMVLNGWAEFEYEGEGVRRIEKGDVLNQRPGIKHREIACSKDFEVLEIVAPANFETRIVDAPESVEAAE